jgi:hypothetical protein
MEIADSILVRPLRDQSLHCFGVVAAVTRLKNS